MAKRNQTEVKDKKVLAFEIRRTSEFGFEKVYKRYIHPEESGGIWAYVRQLLDKERLAATVIQSQATILFKVTHNPKITKDLFLEFGGKTYSIESVDPFEFNKTDLVIRATETSPPTFDEVEHADEY
jgi:SPP1 family predicted phage head-tail adaptor